MPMRCVRGLSLAAMLCVSIHGAAGKEAPLADAVQRHDQQAVLALLKKHADVNAPQSDGATALHWAAYLEDADTASLLIRAGATVDTRNNYGVTPLALASGNGNAAVIDRLLKAGADPNGAVRAGETPLMLAARTGNADAVNAAAERRRKGRGEGNVERADGADVGGCGGARGGRASADRSSGRIRRSFQQWRDASPVCGEARRPGGCPRVGGSWSGRQGGET